MAKFNDFNSAYSYLKELPSVWVVDKNIFNFFDDCLNINIEIVNPLTKKIDIDNKYNTVPLFTLTLDSVKWNKEKRKVDIIHTFNRVGKGLTFEEAIIDLANCVFNL